MNQSFIRRLFHDRSLRGDVVAAFGGAGTMFLIQPPCDVWFFAWLAPLPWLWLIMKKTSHAPPKFWQMIWCAGFIHWLATIHWLRLPHPATSLGLGLFVGLPGGLSACLRLVRSTPDEAVGVGPPCYAPPHREFPRSDFPPTTAGSSGVGSRPSPADTVADPKRRGVQPAASAR